MVVAVVDELYEQKSLLTFELNASVLRVPCDAGRILIHTESFRREWERLE